MSHAFRFIHAADLHLDTPFQGVARPAPGVARALREASLEAWERLVDLALERRVLFVLLAGDIHDGAERGLRAQIRFLAGVRRLDEAGIRTFVVHGNHDPLDGWSAVTGWPAGVTVFGAQRVESVPVELHGAQVAVVHGISYARREVRENLALRFSRAGGPGLHIGLLHANVGSSAEHAAYAPCTLGDLAASGMDYWALGHIHRRAALDTAMPAVYPGCPQARRVRETGDTSVTLVRVGASGSVEISEIPTGALRMEDVEADISDLGAGAYADLAARIHAEFESLRAGFPPHVKCCVARVRLRGEGPMQRLTLDPYLQEHGKSAVEYTASALNALEESRSPRIWVREIDASGCRPEKEALDIDALRGEDSLAGDVVRLADALAARTESHAEITCASLLNSLRNSNAANDRLLFRHLERAAADNAAPVAAGDTIGDALAVCLDALRESL